MGKLKEDDSIAGMVVILLMVGFMVGMCFGLLIQTIDNVTVDKATMNNVCKTIAGNNTIFDKVDDGRWTDGKTKIVCKLQQEKIYDSGSIVLR